MIAGLMYTTGDLVIYAVALGFGCLGLFLYLSSLVDDWKNREKEKTDDWDMKNGD